MKRGFEYDENMQLVRVKKPTSIVIEKTKIPIPGPIKGKRTLEWLDVIDKINHGESFVMEEDLAALFYNLSNKVRAKSGKQFRRRRLGESQVRMWCVRIVRRKKEVLK